MSDQPSQVPNGRFKAEMPQIPGISPPAGPSKGPAGKVLIAIGLLAVFSAALLGSKFFSRAKQAESTITAPQAAIPIPGRTSPPDLSPAVPPATEENPVIARVGELSKPWASVPFSFRNRATGETVQGLLVRLPGGSPSSVSGYWAITMRAAFGSCRLQYLEDLGKLRSDYGFSARHPMLVNPCTRSLFDPLKYTTVSGNSLARGAVVTGSDLRPPLAIEIRIKGKEILASRME
jgi:hypothetical protein